MAFKGIFVGIDRYASTRINELNCAARDAIALHAMFEDNLGGIAELLIDEEATRAAIEEKLASLTTCEEDDVVVLAFSGHGSETHELVTYDADLRDLPNTCIPLDTLADWFSRIPAKRLICFLDCCFSGGLGAKVLKVDALPRSLASADELLNQLSGEGRFIVTASSATEEAWEDSRHGHGLLTLYILEALQGAEEVRQAGRVPTYLLLQYVTQRVIAAATLLGQPQHPTLRGQLDGGLTWPVFHPGDRFRAAFPEYASATATTDLQSLSAFGFPAQLIDAWAQSIPSLNPLQVDAINEFRILEGEHVVVSAPTSSGKTMIGELVALKGALNRSKALFLFPLKALVNDKLQQFNRTYGPFGIRTIRATGETTIDDILPHMRGHYDICLMTYEKFAALALGTPHILKQIGTIVVDEVQMIADPSRGTNLEFILTLLRMRRQQGIEPQVICLSAVIGDTNGLEQWLGGRLLRRTERPVPLDEGLLLGDGSVRSISSDGSQESLIPNFIRKEPRNGGHQDWIIPLVRKLVAEGKQVIVFRETKGDARGTANYLAGALGLPRAQDALNALPTGDPSAVSQALRGVLEGGVAFHISDLDREERLAVEEAYRAPNSSIRVIAATTTLAMGVNTPAEAVIIAGLEHPGPTPYSIAEYKNIIGRAGRLPFVERGSSYLLAVTPREEHLFWSYYVQGVPEDLVSRFLADDTDPRSLVLRVLASVPSQSEHGLTEDELVTFLEGSFGAFRQLQTSEHWVWNRTDLLAALAELNTHGLVEQSAAGGYHLTALGILAGQSGVEVESIIRIIEALRPLDPNTISDPALVATAQLTVELDDVLFPINKSSTQKEPQAWHMQLEQQFIPAHLLRTMGRFEREPGQATLRKKKAVACLFWITDLPIADIEAVMLQFGRKSDGAAGALRSVSARTCDLLPTVISIASLLHPALDLADRGVRLITRLEVGVPAPTALLASIVGSRLTRGDYQRLMKAGLADLQTIEDSPDEVLLACLGDDQGKKQIVRDRIRVYREQIADKQSVLPLLPAYES